MDENNRKHTPEEISGRMNLMAGIFQKDAQISTLQQEKIQIMQQLYELEMKMYGRMSRIGREIFEVEHCEVFHGRVRQMTESEWEEDKSGTVRGKLSHYKAVEKQQADSRSQDRQKRETPELV